MLTVRDVPSALVGHFTIDELEANIGGIDLPRITSFTVLSGVYPPGISARIVALLPMFTNVVQFLFDNFPEALNLNLNNYQRCQSISLSTMVNDTIALGDHVTSVVLGNRVRVLEAILPNQINHISFTMLNNMAINPDTRLTLFQSQVLGEIPRNHLITIPTMPPQRIDFVLTPNIRVRRYGGDRYAFSVGAYPDSSDESGSDSDSESEVETTDQLVG